MKSTNNTPARRGRPRMSEDGTPRPTLTACITQKNHDWVCKIAAEQAGPLAGRRGRALDKIIQAARTLI